MAVFPGEGALEGGFAVDGLVAFKKLHAGFAADGGALVGGGFDGVAAAALGLPFQKRHGARKAVAALCGGAAVGAFDGDGQGAAKAGAAAQNGVELAGAQRNRDAVALVLRQSEHFAQLFARAGGFDQAVAVKGLPPFLGIVAGIFFGIQLGAGGGGGKQDDGAYGGLVHGISLWQAGWAAARKAA